MKKKLKNIKWSRVGWIVAGLVVFYFSISAVDYKSSLPLQEINIHIENNNGLLFLGDSDVQQMLTDIGIESGHSRLTQTNCNKIERTLEQNPWTADAQVYIDALAKLHVEISQ